VITRDAELVAAEFGLGRLESATPLPGGGHVYGRDRLDPDAVGTSLAAAASQRPWTDLEAALWPATGDRPALRGRPVGHGSLAGSDWPDSSLSDESGRAPSEAPIRASASAQSCTWIPKRGTCSRCGPKKY
jgi:hypothetical protein